MKKIFLLLVMVFSFGEMFANNDFAHVLRKIEMGKGVIINKAPYQNEPVISFYDTTQKVFIIWFCCSEENAEIIITKDGESVASDVFNVNAEEGIECDMSRYEEGEYIVYVVTDGGIQALNSFYRE